MTTVRISFAALVVLAACAGPGRIDGVIDGEGTTVGAGLYVLPLSEKPDYGARIELTNAPELCEVIAARRRPSSETFLRIDLNHFSEQNTRLPIDPGTYTIVTTGTATGLGEETRYALVKAVRTDATCRPTTGKDASTGTVTVREVSERHIVGTFAAEGDGLSVTGEFSVERCADVNPAAATDCLAD